MTQISNYTELGVDFFTEVVNLTTDAVIVTQEDQVIIYCNPAAVGLFGYTEDEMVGQPLNFLLPSRFHTTHQEYVTQFGGSALQSVAKAQREQLQAQHKNGREIAVEISIMKLLRNGRIYYAALLHDVSARQETADSLSQYARRLEALREMDRAILAAYSPEEVAQTALTYLKQLVPFEHAGVIAYSSPPSGLSSGDTFLATYGNPPIFSGQTTLLTAFHDKAVSQTLKEKGARLVNRLQKSEPTLPFETLLIRQEIRSYIMAPLSVRDNLVGVMVLGTSRPDVFDETHVDMVRDAARPVAVAIHQAHLLEEERTQRRFAETLQEVARILSSTLDREKVLHVVLDQLARVIAYDSAVVLLLEGDTLHLAAQKDVGQKRPCSQLQDSSQPHLREILNTGVPLLIRDTAQDGRWRPCCDTDTTRSWLGVPLIVKGIVIGLLNLSKNQPDFYSSQDARFAQAFARQASIAVENAQLYSRATREIDERRQAEAALQIERAHLAERVKERTAELSAANAQLARAMRARDEFLASMSHELRTPLNAILGMTEVLQTRAYGSLTEKQIDMLRTIIRSGYHLLDLINDVLDIAKIEAGQLSLQPYPLPVASVCHTCIDLVRAQAEKKRIHIQYAATDDVVMVWADELRMQQILINLLNNAIKFTPAGGQIGLEVTGNPERNIVNFSVWDTGIGMSLNDLRQLFSGPNGPKPFVQLDSGLSRQYEGTGLGLSLVYHLTELHGGSLAIKSEVGQGSRLTVSLPGYSIIKEVESQESGQTQLKPTKTILLAEDNEIYARAISTCLLDQGYRLVVVHTGLQAVQQVRNLLPDLILMDLQMPEIGGMEALNLIRENTELRDVPVIMWSALAMPGYQEYYLRQGVNAFMQKPLYLPELTAKITELLAG